MRTRLIWVGAALLANGVLFGAGAEPGDRHLNKMARVLDQVFPLDVTPLPYFSKMVLRFGDTRTQLVAVVYPGGKAELIRYQLAGVSDAGLSKLLAEADASPGSDLRHVTDNVRVDVTRSRVDSEALDRFVAKLKAVRISPILWSGVCVDECSEYEFWYDTWQESVHYTLTSGQRNADEDQLVRWMDEFRKNVPRWLLSRPATPE